MRPDNAATLAARAIEGLTALRRGSPSWSWSRDTTRSLRTLAGVLTAAPGGHVDGLRTATFLPWPEEQPVLRRGCGAPSPAAWGRNCCARGRAGDRLGHGQTPGHRCPFLDPTIRPARPRSEGPTSLGGARGWVVLIPPTEGELRRRFCLVRGHRPTSAGGSRRSTSSPRPPQPQRPGPRRGILAPRSDPRLAAGTST